MKYRIAVNTLAVEGKLPPGDVRWARFNDSFVNQELETFDIANAIYTGHSYAAWHNGRRKDANFVCGQHIAVDMETHDERSSIEHLMGLDFVRVYASLIYSTPSHTEADPRSRILFLLDTHIDSASAYEAAIRFVYSLFPGSDLACVDSSRFFYGNKDCRIEWLDNTLPLAHLRSYYARWQHIIAPPPARKQPLPASAQQASAATSKLTPDIFLDYAIRDSGGEGRNNRGYRLAHQLREAGLSQFEAEDYMRLYQQAVERNGPHNYTEAEALLNLRSAYTKGVMH